MADEKVTETPVEQVTETTETTAPVELKTELKVEQTESADEVKGDEKTDEKKEEEQEEEANEFDTAEVIKQVEFYFSDTNLPKDKFLWRTVQSNQDGWVSISTLASFNRMKKFRPITAVSDALRKSEFLVVSENGELVRRKNAILPPKESDKQLRFQRSVYAKGFPEETESTQTELEKWFAQFGKVNEVRMRRDEKKEFKRSVFAEFADQQDAKNFAELSPKPTYGDKELEVVMSKPAYVEMKANNENFGGANKRKFNGFKHGKGKRARRD